MENDEEGFSYPVVNKEKCTGCSLCVGKCHNARPVKRQPAESQKYYGGYIRDDAIRRQSTSGGAFSALVDAFCEGDFVVFGASLSKDLTVSHEYVFEKSSIGKFRKSKYAQSAIGDSYKFAERFLKEGRKVVFSGLPCQIAGLNTFLGEEYDKLLTIDLVCQGVPSPIFI
jgi:coenzyme F420-reducing hydrogenase beta subunit